MTTTPSDGVNAQGAAPGDLNPGQTGVGNKQPPAPSNAPPPKVDDDGKDEEHGVPLDAAKKEAEKKAKEAADATAAKEAEDKAAADKAKENDGEYITLGDEAGDAAIALLKEAGVTRAESDAYFEKAIASGDLNDVNWKAIESRIGAAKTKLVRIGVEKYYNDVYTANVAAVTAVHDVMGGKDNWDKVVSWAKVQEAKDPAFKKELAEIRQGIDAGGRSAKYAAADLKALYEKAPGNNGLGVSKVQQGNNKPVDTVGAISRAEYIKQMHVLTERRAPPAEIAALRESRRKGMQAGI